jgi:hypothetical protein
MTEGSWPWPEEMDGVLAAPGSHQVLIDNDRVRVLEVSIGPTHREPEHTHRRPSVMIVDGPVRAENRIHGSDQQSCSPGSPPVMITDHVPAVDVPPDHATSRVAAAVPA